MLEQTETGAILDVDSVVDLTDRVLDETLDWTAPDDGTWRLYTYWMHGTGQTASPSASVNYTVNYLDPDGAQAVIDYWDSVVLTPALREQIARTRARRCTWTRSSCRPPARAGCSGAARSPRSSAPVAATTSPRGCRSSPGTCR